MTRSARAEACIALGLLLHVPFAARAQQAGAPAAEHGRISWYGAEFEGRRTASGETFHRDSMTMAHRSLPFGTRVKVTNLHNRRSIVVRVTDRGPADSTRVGDVSEAAARELGMWRKGTAKARLDVITP